MLNMDDLVKTVESLASDVEEIKRAYVDVPYSKVVEGQEYHKVRRVKIDEYCLGGYKYEVAVSTVCLGLLRDIIKDMPKVPAKLYWRVKPTYEQHEEFETGKMKFKIRLRLGWLEDEDDDP